MPSAGQVVGVVSSGDASVDATNRSEDVDITTGEASGSNETSNLTGQTTEFLGSLNVGTSDIIGAEAPFGNIQEGDNSSSVAQAADATTGDGVAGQVIGVVTAAGGSADIVAANTTTDSDVETGEAETENTLAALVGQNNAFQDTNVGVADIIDSSAPGGNIQEGDNDLSSDQSANATTGDGVAGQVIGAVSAGDASIDATNRSDDVDIETGGAEAENAAASLVGLNESEFGDTNVDVADIVNSHADAGNIQEGDNETEQSQDASAATGDGVGGQVIGAVTSAGGSADIVAANTTTDADIETGGAEAENELASLTGQNNAFNDTNVGVADIIDSSADFGNLQEGDNDLSADQAANATTGDGVAGQILGVVSAGDASVDATNRTDDVDVVTGDALATNAAARLTGQNVSFLGDTNVDVADITGSSAANLQEGDNSGDLSQAANAATGDAVGGQVAGVVTSAGGSADLVLSNTSEDVDGDTGDSTFANLDEDFVGQAFSVEGGLDI